MDEDFAGYVSVAWPRLLRSAFVLTGDWYRAEDLLQSVLARAYRRWAHIAAGHPDAYLRSMLATTYLSWRRRRWRAEVPTADLPEAADRGGTDTETRIGLAAALTQLPPRQRAVVMLRFQADLTEARTAELLGLSVGTVKSYTARALTTLRADPAVRALLVQEAPR